MSETAHTEGPWEWDGTGMILRSQTGVNERGGMTGGVCVAQMWTKPSRSDAALMKAAPEMLEALRPFAQIAVARDAVDPDFPDDFVVAAYVSEFRGQPIKITLGDCRIASALIAKAEGRS